MIHKNCLADWVDSRKVFRSTKATDCYWWRSVYCEVCKTPYKDHTMENNNILRYDKDKFESYMILESYSSSQSKCLHVVNLSNNDQEFTIG